MNDIGAVLAALLTLFVLSYLIGDNPFYRLAASLFVGLTAGYAVVVAFFDVIAPQIVVPLWHTPSSSNASQTVFAVLSLILAVTLLFKMFASTTRPASCVTALLVGVGVAVAVGGTVLGTLLPQISAAALPLLPSAGRLAEMQAAAPAADPLQLKGEYFIEAVFMLVGTISTLGFFYYGGRARPGQPAARPAWVKTLAPLGEVFLGTTFGVMYAGAIVAGLAVFAQSWLNVMQGFQVLWNLRSLLGLH
jgi:hypothetical protein